jgi:lipopolysaccharide/colanic/teichoic acid biosynthesis glycosyltransferase
MFNILERRHVVYRPAASPGQISAALQLSGKTAAYRQAGLTGLAQVNGRNI